MARSSSLASMAARPCRIAAGLLAGALVLLAGSPAVAAECSQPAPGVRMGECNPSPSEPAPAPAPEPAPAPQEGPDDAAAARLLVLANRDRAAHGLSPLAPRDDVTSQAVDWSGHMASTGTLAHNDGYFTAANRSRLDAAALAENVAYNHDVDDAHRRLMESPGHRANLLDPRFSVVGIGVVRDADGRFWITQDFVQPANGPAAAAPTVPAPAPAAPAAAPTRRPSPAATPSTATTAVTPAATVVTTTEAPPPQPAGGSGDGSGDGSGGDVELALGPSGSGAGVPAPDARPVAAAVRLAAVVAAGAVAAALLRRRRRPAAA